ncbi:MAG: MBL fold metallo-hydrolase [Chloroflexi bacterium]|nr:MBL fold metallo-hydrolase [Chloroflexota bacterium]MCY3581600.1 MBL fold metallo-hydrolase [Chloroflexota bacterium]MCY3717403.1 MBL fold metallo-hydrolase [Chloroflexota bacterium]MDE2650049.1 MBL fold metallo-hydrolase [Chloroflexota bacterium]MXV93091.1 MBL fold metallo-hydrolase [Chloroflexota bacterium]
MSRTQVVILGSGTPNADPDRVSASLAVVVDDQPYLVDCGHGAVQRVVEARARGLIAWDTTALTRLFVTHLHGDHTVGLPDLLYTPWIHERQSDIKAIGPRGLAEMARHIELAYSENIREHRSAHPSSRDGYKIAVREVAEGCVYEDDLVTVEALAADHGDLAALSYKFITPNGSIVISGDTKPVADFAGWARGCDLLLHEVYSAQQFANRPLAWQAYHARAHTSSDELAALASVARPKWLVLVHQLFWGQTPAELVAEVLRGYDGEVISASDLDVYAL